MNPSWSSRPIVVASVRKKFFCERKNWWSLKIVCPPNRSSDGMVVAAKGDQEEEEKGSFGKQTAWSQDLTDDDGDGNDGNANERLSVCKRQVLVFLQCA